MDLTFVFIYSGALKWAQNNGGLISTLGALIIFFSWVVTNTLGQKYGRVKSSVESGQSTFRLYTTFNELRGSLNSLAMEVLQFKNDTEARISAPEKETESEVDVARESFSLTRISAY